MTARVLKGSKQEIADTVVRMSGDVREVIVFVEEPGEVAAEACGEDVFAEMERFMVRVGGVDYSREAMYSRAEGE